MQQSYEDLDRIFREKVKIQERFLLWESHGRFYEAIGAEPDFKTLVSLDKETDGKYWREFQRAKGYECFALEELAVFWQRKNSRSLNRLSQSLALDFIASGQGKLDDPGLDSSLSFLLDAYYSDFSKKSDEEKKGNIDRLKALRQYVGLLVEKNPHINAHVEGAAAESCQKLLVKMDAEIREIPTLSAKSAVGFSK